MPLLAFYLKLPLLLARYDELMQLGFAVVLNALFLVCGCAVIFMLGRMREGTIPRVINGIVSFSIGCLAISAVMFGLSKDWIAGIGFAVIVVYFFLRFVRLFVFKNEIMQYCSHILQIIGRVIRTENTNVFSKGSSQIVRTVYTLLALYILVLIMVSWLLAQLWVSFPAFIFQINLYILFNWYIISQAFRYFLYHLISTTTLRWYFSDNFRRDSNENDSAQTFVKESLWISIKLAFGSICKAAFILAPCSLFSFLFSSCNMFASRKLCVNLNGICKRISNYFYFKCNAYGLGNMLLCEGGLTYSSNFIWNLFLERGIGKLSFMFFF
jgi:hypothetical protein